jgi:hypothetical protein
VIDVTAPTRPVVLYIPATDQLEGADVSGVISEGGERRTELYGADAPMVLPLEVSTMLEQDEGKTRATWRRSPAHALRHSPHSAGQT